MAWKAAAITVSDKGFAGEREDRSGPLLAAGLARLLKTIAGNRQVLCITHLPQVAAAGDRHLQIGKSVQEGVTETSVCYLENAARVEEVARMLGGEEITKKTRAHAKELLSA